MTLTLPDSAVEKCKCVFLTSPWVKLELRDSSEISALMKNITPRDMIKVGNPYFTTEKVTPRMVSQIGSEARPHIGPEKNMRSKVRGPSQVTTPVAKVSPRPRQKVRLGLASPWAAWLGVLTLCCAQGLSDATTEAALTPEESLPHFLEPILNKTVVLGRDVILPCSVDNLKGFKVAWIFVETQTILTIHHTIITKNPRFSLARNDHKHWYLRITDVRPSDRGLYMCQVNSDPMMSQVGFLDVQVPPDIIDEESSSEVVVKEGQDVTLECRARGSPKPIISWKREDGGKIDGSNGINLKVTNSEVLHIPTVSRLHMGAYLCIASNNVPPSVSKRILLQVQFQPVLWIPNQLVGVAQGLDVTLECHTESFPKSINYWTDDKGQMILSSGRFDTIVAENGYKAYMRLKIKNIQPEDFQAYICFAKNSFGETNGSVKVYEIPRQLLMNVHDTKKKDADRKYDEDEEREGEDKGASKTPGRSSEPQRESQTKKKKGGQVGRSDRRRGGRRQPDDDDDEDDDDDDMVSTVTPEGVIEFDVQKLLGKNKRKGKHGDEEEGQKRTGFPFDFDPTSFHKLPSSASTLHHFTLLSVVCLWCLTVLLPRV